VGASHEGGVGDLDFAAMACDELAYRVEEIGSLDLLEEAVI